ncbi:lysine-specific demethylase 4A isoform X2 [Syngnathoides biaculeatus]|uniref:lysine-specific demethylase 4A isoform X2 n=1 Tax=Syngnathoides biaculeatus TaxID=300417 RepID=UPI002ADD5FEA|nr:lysine-specific demethylase 4A isoform X2 [Syngnathoides biaculeatus]
MSINSGAPSTAGRGIMTFTPSAEDFRDFRRYVAFMESRGAHRAGMAKVIPPTGWRPRKSYDDTDELVIPAPIQQVVTGQSGLFTQYNIQKKPMTVREFRKTSNTDKFCHPRSVDFDELERKFWKNLTFNPPLYGADVSGSLYDPDVTEWNIGRLETILDTVENESGVKIKGVNTPYLYFGMWKAAFAWHTEDMDLYSINYLHFGEPKSWYAVPPEHGRRLERLAKGFFPGNAQSCEAFLRHKMTLISPSILKKYGIPFEKVTQEAGQFVVTFPYSYHAGFNHGFNCAESTNFATQRWIDYGKRATLCSCRQDMVKISMDVFVRKYQPERYKLWKAGKDNAPVDHSKATPEAALFREESDRPAAGSPEAQTAAKRPLDAAEAELAEEDDDEEEEEEEEPKKAKMESPAKEEPDVQVKLESEPEEEKNHREEEKPNRREDISKEEEAEPPTSRTADTAEVQAAAPCPGDAGGKVPHPGGDTEEPKPDGASPQKVFRRTLSPADVLHVHSYAKGDYAEEEATPTDQRKEEDGGRDDDAHGGKVSQSRARVLLVDGTACVQQGPEEPRGGPKRSDLGQLPGHHPLLKDVLSDEDAPEEATPVKEAGLEGEGWAKPLAHLWQNRPPNVKREREYNRRAGAKPPYCSICSLFVAYQQTGGGGGASAPVVGPGGRTRSKPLIPETCFATTTEEDSERREAAATPRLDEDGTSLLVSCSQCSVRVHASQPPRLRRTAASAFPARRSPAHLMLDLSLPGCYGVDPASVRKEWKCARCKANAVTENCCLCCLRGGALQKANNNKWVHVLCAVAVLEARFVNVAERRPVDLSGIPLQRFKLKCYYCKKRMKKASGCCVQCSHGRCPTAYHPTCAQAAGVLMQPDEWPFVVHVTCCRHKGPAHVQRNKAAMQELTPGQKVICKHKNGRYYQCDVVQLSKETFYEVNFDDGSFSDNLFPEDIVSRDCARLGPPPRGEAVQVRWTDGLVYGAKFEGSRVVQMYLVEFEDGSQLTSKRDDVYSLDEELPKRVKSRLSKASDMRFDGIFEGKEIIRESKRQRVINSRYRGDYIEPVIYRAIME